mmetsp:Transcript_26841/g.77633  ORF Transcript_26841/g.77633 Transcript_26841/m.77633 type:complete len:263 (+) Transcript_26841:83-871(+)
MADAALPTPAAAACCVATAAAAVAEWKMRRAEDKNADVAAAEDMCSTALPSPSLEPFGFNGSGSWESQEIDGFALSDEALTPEDSATAWEFDDWSAVPLQDSSVLVEPPPGLEPSMAEGMDGAMDGYFGVAYGEADALGMQLGCGMENDCSEEFLSAAEWMQSVQCSGMGFALPGHAETGEWAWRTAPRPDFDVDISLPLVVRQGKAPDGCALLEAAAGLEGMNVTIDGEVPRGLGEAMKCEFSHPPLTDVKVHTSCHGCGW